MSLKQAAIKGHHMSVYVQQMARAGYLAGRADKFDMHARTVSCEAAAR